MQKMLAEDNVVVALISDDRAEDVKQYLETTPFPFRFFLDPESRLTFKLEVPVLPTTIVVDSKKRIALSHVGAYDWDSPAVVDALRELSRQE